MVQIKHIVFDIGKVLIHYDPHLAYIERLPDLETRTHFLTKICSNDWNLEQDRGRPWAEAEAVLIAQYPEYEDLIRAFRPNWHKMVSHAYDDSVAILDGLLAQDYDVTFLTNFAADTFVEAQQRFPFLTKGRGVTVSGLIGLLKPDPAIYEHHTKSFDLEPEATLFIDDNGPNIIAAKAYGWQGIQFSSSSALQSELKSFGINL